MNIENKIAEFNKKSQEAFKKVEEGMAELKELRLLEEKFLRLREIQRIREAINKYDENSEEFRKTLKKMEEWREKGLSDENSLL